MFFFFFCLISYRKGYGCTVEVIGLRFLQVLDNKNCIYMAYITNSHWTYFSAGVYHYFGLWKKLVTHPWFILHYTGDISCRWTCWCGKHGSCDLWPRQPLPRPKPTLPLSEGTSQLPLFMDPWKKVWERLPYRVVMFNHKCVEKEN